MGPHVNRWRFVGAVVLIPLFDALLAYLAFPLVWWLGDHGSGRLSSPDGAAAAFAGVSGFLGLLVMATAAAPVTLRQVRQRRVAVHHFAIAGIVLGNLPIAVYGLFAIAMTLSHLIVGTLGAHLSSPGEVVAGVGRVVLIGSFMGCASGVVFWLIVRPEPAVPELPASVLN